MARPRPLPRLLRHARTVLFIAALCGCMCVARMPAGASADDSRSVDGRVVDAGGAPVSGAIVYLNDLRTKAVESYITQEDGHYRFEQISPADDYSLWAQAGGRKSRVKTLSSFDDRADFHVLLKLAAAK